MRFLGFHRPAMRVSVRASRVAPAGNGRWLAAGSEGFRVTAFERPDTAVIVRQRLLENAEDVDALFVLAALHAQDGRVGEGIIVLDQVLHLDPSYPGAWMFKATLHRMHGDNEAERSARAKAEDVDR